MTLKVRWTRRALRRLDQIGVYIVLHLKWPWSRTYSGLEMTSQNELVRDARESVVALAAAGALALSLWLKFSSVCLIIIIMMSATLLPLFIPFYWPLKSETKKVVCFINIVICILLCAGWIYEFMQPTGKIYYDWDQQNRLVSGKENTRTPIVVTFLPDKIWSLAVPYIEEVRRVPAGVSLSQFINEKCIDAPERTKFSMCGRRINLDWYGLSGPKSAFLPIYVDKNTKNNIVIFHMDLTKKKLSIFSNNDLADWSYVESLMPNTDVANLPIGDYIIKIDVVDRGGDPNC